MLYAIQDINVYSVPPGYFNNLPEHIIERVAPKVIAMKRRSVWKYATAAVLTGLIGIFSLSVFNKQQVTTQPETISNTVLADAGKYKNAEQINNEIDKLSDEDIIKYLEKTSSNADNESLTSNLEDASLPSQQDYLNDEKVLDSFLNNSTEKNSN